MISGSHSHHGPVIELTDREGFGKGKFDDAVAYSKRLPELLIEAIVEAKEQLAAGQDRHRQERFRTEPQSAHQADRQADRSDAGRDSLRLGRRQAAGDSGQLRGPSR